MSRDLQLSIDADDFGRASRALDELGKVAARPLEAALEDGGEDVRDAVRRRARRHRRTGQLERSITTRRRGSGLDTVVNVHVGAPYARLIVVGTGPHEIRPVAGRALALGGPIAGVVARVRHPGTPADPFFARGVDDARGDIDRQLGDAGGEIVAELADRMDGRR